MTVPDLEIMAQLLTEQLLNAAAGGIVLAGLVWVGLRLLGRQNSGTRFAVWFLALLAMIALPFFSGSNFLAPRRTVPATNLRGEIILSGSWAFFLFAAWVMGACLLLLRLGVGLWRVYHLRKSFSDVDLASLDPAIPRALQEFGSHRQVTLCISSDITIPAAIGFFRPAIVFPAWLLPQLSVEETKAILLHELAHLHRWDDWTNLAQKIVKAVFFFHPAVWWIENNLTLEREMACDDIVLTQTASPRAYASSLISFAEKLQSARALALAQALVGRMQHMSLRVGQILNAKKPSRTTFWKPVAGVSAGLLTLLLGAAPYMPRLVAFQNQSMQSRTRRIPATNAEAQPRAISAKLTPSDAQVRPHLTSLLTPHLTSRSPRKPVAMRARAAQEQIPVRDTIFVLQTTRFDISGSGVWTLCIWRVRGGNLAEGQLESAIVVSSI
jgi:beta-lactamase regulating signal transducer with metallopeptidase domain